MYIWLNERMWKLPELSGEKMPVQCLEHMKQSKQEGLKLFPCLRDSAASADTKRVDLSLTKSVYEGHRLLILGQVFE
jgi:hypothetical protein